jgi:hypothetical protein
VAERLSKAGASGTAQDCGTLTFPGVAQEHRVTAEALGRRAGGEQGALEERKPGLGLCTRRLPRGSRPWIHQVETTHSSFTFTGLILPPSGGN